MSIVDVPILDESRNRYLTYALSVVSGRALPDVRDGLKPVQRRILYAMYRNLHLTPDKYHRKSAAVVGEVLARYHPHGDSACYEAMVRMAQDFSLRYPLVDGQGNFGSLDGDAAAAYRYTEARLMPLALEVIGDIEEETVPERDNFDQTTTEPVVLPSRVPNLLINGASGIAVGMATAIPPHNLLEVIKALLLLNEDPETPDTKLLQTVKGPDFPTGCQILNSKAELKEIYSTGRGAIRMRGEYKVEDRHRGGQQLVVTSIPFAVDKSSLVEKIAELIISKKFGHLTDVRDESTDEVRVVMELAQGADPDATMAYLFKHTPLQSNFNVNLTALVPTADGLSGRPQVLSLRLMLTHFLDFRKDVTKKKLEYERRKLNERIHLLEGLEKIIDKIDEVIRIVRKSDGRQSAIAALIKRFELSELQAAFIVDLRIYQLSRTSVEEIEKELSEKRKRVSEIEKILKSAKALADAVGADLARVSELFGDKRRSEIVHEFDEPELDKSAFIPQEDVYAIVSKDGWMKRIKRTNDPQTTRLRDGDSLLYSGEAKTTDLLVLFTSFGNLFAIPIHELSATTGFGEPVQKLFRFQDSEQIIAARVFFEGELAKQNPTEILCFTQRGLGCRLPVSVIGETKKIGKRIMKLIEGDRMAGVIYPTTPLLLAVSEQGFGLCFATAEVPQLSGAGKGVLLQKLPREDALAAIASVEKKSKLVAKLQDGGEREIEVAKLTLSVRARRGEKLFRRGQGVISLG